MYGTTIAWCVSLIVQTYDNKVAILTNSFLFLLIEFSLITVDDLSDRFHR